MKALTDRFYRRAAWAWAVLVLCLLLAAAFTFDASRVKTDVRSLLPQEEQTADASQIFSAVADKSAGRFFVTISASTSEGALAAAEAAEHAFQSSGLAVTSADAAVLKETLRFLTPYRALFLTDADKAFLQSASDAAVAKRALKNLYRPVSSVLLPWQDDPLGLFAARFQELFADPKFSVQGRYLTVGSPSDPKSFAVVLNVSATNAIGLSGTPLTDAIRAARTAAQKITPDAVLAAAGPQLMAEAAASAAQREATVIGTVSAIGIALMVLVFLRALAPAVWMTATLGLSFLTATAAVWLAFGEIHLLTIVFGATLLGVAADYVFHYLTELFHQPTCEAARQELAGGLFVSLLTSLAGYCVMFFVPMPALRQMALFCMTGLASAFAFVMLFGPAVTHSRPMPQLTQHWGSVLRQSLRLSAKKAAFIAAALLLASAPGLLRLATGDELALLNSIPADVLAEQQAVSEKVAPTSPGQFFVVRGHSTDDVLEHLTQLKPLLKEAVKRGVITGFRTGEGPLLSTAEQAANRKLTQEAANQAITAVEKTLGAPVAAPSAISDKPLTLHDWLQSDAGRLFSSFWLSDTGTVVYLSGVTPASLATLAQLAEKIPETTFVNTTGGIRASLSHWRNNILLVLAGAFCLMAAFLATIYRRRAIRMVLPTALGLFCTAGLLGWIGVPVSLFTVLPMILLLGLGADYAVLLYAKPAGTSVHVSVFLAAVSTLLSFGLLAFSSTPALRHFGLSLWIGLSFVWFYTMLFRPNCSGR